MNKFDGQGNTILHKMAVNYDYSGINEYFKNTLQSSIAFVLNSKNKDGVTPLMLSIFNPVKQFTTSVNYDMTEKTFKMKPKVPFFETQI